MTTANLLHQISKPHFINHSFPNSKLSKEKLCRRHYKYIHHLQIDKTKQSLRTLSKLKFISSLDSSSRGSHSTHLFLLEKLLKSHSKYLKSLGKSLQSFRFLKPLPLLDQLNLSQDQAHWRLLTTRSAFTTLTFNLDNSPIQNFFKYKTSLRRSLPQMRALNSLKIKASNQDIDLILSLLEIINEKVHHLGSLKNFGLSIEPSNSQDNPQPLYLTSVEIDKALECLTTHSIEDADRYSLLFSLGKFKNLSDLHLSYFPKEESDLFRQVAHHVKDLPKLKKLTLSFEARSSVCEAQFYENFTTPPSLEHLDLTLIDFKLNANRKVLQQTFERNLGSCCQNVKFINLSIHFPEGTHSDRIGQYTSLFIQRFGKLEQFFFHATQLEDSNSATEDQTKELLELEDIWKGLIILKNTLTSISINSDIIASPENIEALETRFLRLESLSLRGDILYPDELGTFCWRIPSLKHIILRDLIFTDEKSLKRFLLSWRYIPREMNINLCLNVEEIQKQQLFIDCLVEYIQEVKIKGMLKMTFVDVCSQDIKGFQGIFDLAREKGCFEEFSFTSNWGVSMFQIVKNTVRSICEGFILSS